MYFSIIINTHNQYKTFDRCLKSCLNQNFKGKYEIIIIDTSDKKKSSNYKLFNSKKVHYYHYKKFSKFPEVDQLIKVLEGTKRSKGHWFCLIDGDDFFKKDKLQYIFNNFNLKNRIIIQDKCLYYNEYNKTYFKKAENFYKNNKLYKKIINFWPQIYGTSCISGNIKVLKSFFNLINIDKKNYNFNRWNKLAIDALLILYAENKKINKLSKEFLTNKSIGNFNNDKQYTVFSLKYWERRIQQINFWENLTQKKIYNLDKLFSKIIKSIF